MAAPLRKTVWLLPAIYIIHNVEEYLFIGRFAAKHDIHTSMTESQQAIIYATILGLAAMIAGYKYAKKTDSNFWLLAIIGALFLNGVTHSIQAIYFRDYVPGLITSLIFYLPFCGYLLISSFRHGILETRKVPLLILASLLITAVILIFSFGMARIA
jgi:hypothetical protein